MMEETKTKLAGARKKPVCMPSFLKAIKQAGGVSALGRAIGVSKQAIYSWRRIESLPAEWVKPIAKASGVPAAEIRPDLFGED